MFKNLKAEIKLKKMSIAQRQIFAAECFLKFCSEKRIYHKSIDELVDHLFSIESYNNLVEWERKGADLDLQGRGVEIPKQVLEIIPARDLNSFCELLEYTVELGIVDLYGATTQDSFLFSKKCVSILVKNDSEMP